MATTKAASLLYGKTPTGQLLYDLCFVKRTDKYLARKHEVTVAEIRHLREIRSVQCLALELKQTAKKGTPHAK